MRSRIRAAFCLACLLLIAGCAANAPIATQSSRVPAAAIDESHRVTLAGNVPLPARSGIDEGAIPPGTRLDRLLLVLRSSPQQQSALDELVNAQQDPYSPLDHRWLTPEEFGARFGAGNEQLAQVAGWLTAHGFTVDEIPAGRRLVIFSGTAGQVLSAFHTELHRYRVNGAEHIANAQDPQIPAALAGVVEGVVSLHDFRRQSEIRTRSLLDAEPEYTAGSTHYLFPADFATIYDLDPLYSAGTDGAGSSTAIAGRSNIDPGDVATFRSIAGLPANTPAVIVDGTNPRLAGSDQLESTLDVEWSGAVAPMAEVNLVIAASTAATDGVDLASAYIVNHAAAPVVSVSYGSCEQDMGSAELAFYNALWEQAASQGMSVFVASGDAGAAGCQAGGDSMGSQAAVNGLCSSPYATCVGGTEFNEGTDPAQYWSAANAANYGSALSYIPEEVWNESALNGGTDLWASGGGMSVVYAQPEWQAGTSGAGAANRMRAVPDVALSAADHDGYFMVEGGTYWIVSGTSVAAPAFAGVMDLVVNKHGGTGQGHANPGFYSLAAAANSPFHATGQGNNSVPGVAGFTANGAAYNLATGLGSVDAALLVNGWSAAQNNCSRFGLLPVRCRPPRRMPILLDQP